MGRSRVTVETADASRLAATHGGAAGVLSCFGLQQMPEPQLVLADWVRALAPRAQPTTCCIAGTASSQTTLSVLAVFASLAKGGAPEGQSQQDLRIVRAPGRCNRRRCSMSSRKHQCCFAWPLTTSHLTALSGEACLPVCRQAECCR